MKKLLRRYISLALTFVLAFSVLSALSISASAASVSDLKYSIESSKVTITGCIYGISGELVIPNTIDNFPVTAIGGAAFSSCSSLTSITIPSSVTSIGKEAFLGCTGLTSINVQSENPTYCDIEGVLFNKDISILIQYPAGKANIRNYGIPSGVTRIGDYAFYGCSSLTSITIPNSVTNLGDYAFEFCRSLTSITISNSVTSIGDYAFESCYSLSSITIPNSVTSIGDHAFDGCSSLTSIKVQPENPSYCDIEGVLFNKDISILIQYPAGKTDQIYNIPNGVISIGDYAVYGCSRLTSITIPSSVTSIGCWAFYFCYNIKSITIPNSVTSIGDHAFDYCNRLTLITIPSGITRIGDYAFEFCCSLTSITIPNSVTSIGDNAFERCYSLTSMTIPSSVTSIGHMAFAGCYSLSLITVNQDNPTYCDINGILFNKDISILINYPAKIADATYAIPSSITRIEDCAFESCNSLTSITIPNSVTSIGGNAFARCSSLTSITIPSSVTSIGDSAFYACSSLTSITIPNSVTSIGGNAFAYCSSLTSITIPNSVTSIGGSAFYVCGSLTSITIPSSVTSIGDSAFYACSSLPSITIPNSVTSIGRNAFADCSSLTSITIPNSVTSIEYYTFVLCVSLTSITIPKSVTSIKNGAFNECNNLQYVYFMGNEQQFANVDIQDYNSSLLSASIHYNSCIGSATHTYDNNCDTTCNVCGATRIIHHIYDSYSDIECSICGSTRREAPVPPTVASVTETTAVMTDTTLEYSTDCINWQQGGEVSGLVPAKTQDIYARFPASDDMEPSASVKFTVTTNKTKPLSPSEPTISSYIDNSVTLSLILGYEYKCNDGNWQTSNVFTGLSPNTQYKFYQRIAETNTAYASDPSAALEVTTLKSTVNAPSAPSVESKTDYSVTLSTISGCEYKCNDGNWQTSNVFTGLSPNTMYKFYQRVTETNTAYASDPSNALEITTLKSTANAPSAPTVENKTSNSVTLSAISGYEYKCNDGEWQASNVFTGLKSETYKFYQRVAETDNSYASESSDATEVEIVNIIHGDVNMDGKINIIDALSIFKHIAGKKLLSGLGFTAADVDKNGKITISDALAIFKHIGGKQKIDG